MKSQLLYIDSYDRHSIVEVECGVLVLPWVLFAKLRRMLLVPFWLAMVFPRMVISLLYVVVLNSFYSGVRGSQSWD